MQECTNIIDIYIPACVRIVHDYGFSSCSGVTRAVFDESCNTLWTRISFYSIYEQVQPTCIAARYFTEYFVYENGGSIVTSLLTLDVIAFAMMTELYL